MGAEQRKNFKSSSWPKTVVWKWLNLKSAADEFHSDHHGGRFVGNAVGRRTRELRMFVGTWNVGGRAPHEGSENIADWLTFTPSLADIFVLGFQEIVPLTAGNVLGAEDKGPAEAWLALIRRSLNSADTGSVDPQLDLAAIGYDDSSPEQSRTVAGGNGGQKYYLVASKQMVGIFLCVWIRAELLRHVSSIKISCVGRGIMGYMGNKGSVSISMRIRRTKICFVCSHLTSGEKDGDVLRRNHDVTEILKKTRFPKSPERPARPFSPETILDHDQIIWLGDLNYRLTSTASFPDVNELLQRNEWQALLEKDQLSAERREGRVFSGWKEAAINFPPTYKYLANSDRYAVKPAKSKEKRRTPAWCDRILWRGKGMQQMRYVRGESRFSDHRPVYSLFSVRLDGEHDPGTHHSPEAAAARLRKQQQQLVKQASRGRGAARLESSQRVLPILMYLSRRPAPAH